MPRRAPPRVILLIESSRAYGRGCLQGIAAYVRARGPWSCVHVERGLSEGVPAWLAALPADGIIARIENPAMARFLKSRGLPTVDLRGRHIVPAFATFDTDANAVARLAADHFLERGFRHVGYCGFAGLDFSDRRRDALARCLAGRGLAPLVHDAADPGHLANTVLTESEGALHIRELADWVRRLPKPVGILTCNDVRGRQLLAACAVARVRVPEDVAVVGVDNDEVLCDLSDPSLSSVQPDTHRLGYEGAAMLDRMMRSGRKPPRRVRMIPPKRLVTRRSSDVLAVDDAVVADAMRIIWRDACQGLNVERLLDQMTVSRATLERRFDRVLQRSPKEEILRLRIGRVQQLLADTDLSLSDITARSGFRTAAHLSVAFKSHTGMTPGAFRRSHRQ